MSAIHSHNVSQNQQAKASSALHASETEMTRFDKLRPSSKYDVITVIPNKVISKSELAPHFPNAARKANEFQGHEIKPDSFFKRLKNAVGGIGKDKSHLEIEESDLVHWRRAHLAAKDKSRTKANAERSAAFIEARKARLEKQDKLWKSRALQGGHKDEISAKKAHLKQELDAADARREKRISEMKTRLANKDKDRKARAKKALADRKKLATN